MGLNRAIWLYLILLIAEGALRKWVLPGLATPLLIVRDPIAAFMIFQAFRLNILPTTPVFFLSYFIAIISVFAAVLIGHGSLNAALYGARPLILHFPAMFIMARALDRSDLLQIGRFVMLLSIPMTGLIAWQFYSPQSAWVNVGVGGEGSSGFSGALGYYRPSGSFSFTSGVSLFYALQASFLLYFWLSGSRCNRVILYFATLSLFIAVPLSISRTLVFQCSLVLVFSFFVSVARANLLQRGLVVGLSVVSVFIVLSFLGIFETSLDVIRERFIRAGEAEGGVRGTLGDRYVGGLVRALTGSGDWPFWGHGIGRGTNVGAKLISGDVSARLDIAENEWQRWVGELGALLGLSVLWMRTWVTAVAASQSVMALGRGDILPWLLLCNAATVLPQGSWNQPNALGFSVLAGALLIASTRHR